MGPLRSRVIAAASVVAVLALGATGVALADDNGTPNPLEPSSSADTGDRKRPELGTGHHGGRHGPGKLGRGALHGEFVVPDSDGGFQTIVTQRGEATAVSGDEITVRSEDGFTSTYAVTEETLVNSTRDGIEDIEKGEDVHVVATKDGGTATAVRIGDRSARGEMRKRFGLDRPEGRA